MCTHNYLIFWDQFVIMDDWACLYQQYSYIQMQSPVFTSSTKNKSQMGEQARGKSGRYTQGEQFQRSNSQEKQNQHAYIIAYLTLEKNIRNIMHLCRKIVSKTQRYAFRKIKDNMPTQKYQKHPPYALISVQSSKTKKQSTKSSSLPHNPQKINKQIPLICIQITELSLVKLVHVIQKRTATILLNSWTQLKGLGLPSLAEEYTNTPQNNGPYESQSITKGGSRLSNKRKTTKGREEHKQNSHTSNVQLSAENQRLRNQIMIDDYEREAFVQQLGQLLDRHQKHLTQGSMTARNTKKNR